MYKNAGIKSVKEAIDRLIAGEVFYSEMKNKIIYDKRYILLGKNPFLMVDKFVDGVAIELDHSWELVDSWLIKVDWKESISMDTPLLCKNTTTDKIWLVGKYDSTHWLPFETFDAKVRCSNVTPLTKDEVAELVGFPKKELVNAGLKSIEEAMVRLIQGETFYSEIFSTPIRYIPSFAKNRQNPFKCGYDDDDLIDTTWDCIRVWNKQVYTVDKPILCWLDNTIVLTNDINENTKPLTLEEAKRYAV